MPASQAGWRRLLPAFVLLNEDYGLSLDFRGRGSY